MAERALLVANGGGLGDSLIASLVASALRSRYAAVDAVCLPAHADAFTHRADVDEVFASTRGLPDLSRALRPRRYAAAIVTWATQENALLPVLAGIPRRVGQARRLYSFLFTDRVVVRSERGDTQSHWSEILLDYARALGCETDHAVPVFAPRASEAAQADELLRALGVGEPFALLHATCAVSPRRPVWPLEAWSALARAMRERYGWRILLVGAPADRPIVDALAVQSGSLSIAGRTSVGSLGALALRAQATVAMHSGPMHVAAAVGAPTVGIFPLRVDFPERWRPLGPKVAVVRNSYPCPLGPDHRMETCRTYDCVARLDVGRVLDALDEVLTRPQPSLRVAPSA